MKLMVKLRASRIISSVTWWYIITEKGILDIHPTFEYNIKVQSYQEMHGHICILLSHGLMALASCEITEKGLKAVNLQISFCDQAKK
jgi:hypothetical protein